MKLAFPVACPWCPGRLFWHKSSLANHSAKARHGEMCRRGSARRTQRQARSRLTLVRTVPIGSLVLAPTSRRLAVSEGRP
jgi:hypothetical protein